MRKQMNPISVHTDEEKGLIFIEQEDLTQEVYQVMISPDQVSVLVQWLQEAKEELDALRKKRSQET